jgi:hypothetical protein
VNAPRRRARRDAGAFAWAALVVAWAACAPDAVFDGGGLRGGSTTSTSATTGTVLAGTTQGPFEGLGSVEPGHTGGWVTLYTPTP